MNVRRLVLFILTAFGLAGAGMHASAGAAPETVIVVPIRGTIDAGMAHLTQRAVDEARARHAAIVLDVNTFGGLVASATEIRDALMGSGVPVLAFVGQRAWSAGALVTLSAQRITLGPAASIGDAEPIPKTAKTVSALRGEFESTAVEHHRDRRIAAAMVDASLDVPGVKAPGSILTLTADRAVALHVADSIQPDLRSAMRAWGLERAQVVNADYTWAERLARFATDPQVSGLLLSIGMLGLLIEMQTLHGIAGTIGVLAFGLFFGTHVYAGFSNTLVIGLAVLGVIAILFELHVVPGHGVAGMLGVIALVAAVVLAFGLPFMFVAAQSLSIAIVLSVLFFWLTTRIFPENAFVQRLALTASQGPDYVASSDYSSLLGKTGVATSYLRPAGVANVEGRRIDVLTQGDFLPAGTPIKITRVEGARIFVVPIEEATAALEGS
ncbi:MAG TPA: NfeD family protein [Candidatus Binatia bacterium]|nr:NfeD family protein [Candidatus Binatia bacterium]